MTTGLSAENAISQRLVYSRLWYALGAVMLLVVALLSLLPVPNVGVNDKVSHLMTYFLLAGWFGVLARHRATLLWTIVALIAYGMMMEGLQSMTGYRFAEWGDVVANTSGCLLGGVLYFTPLRRLFRFIDTGLASIRRR